MEPELEQPIYNLEDKRLNIMVSIIQRDFQMLCEPPEWLRDVESPFKWMRALQRILFVSWDIPDKLLDYRNQGAYYGFEKFTLLLSMAARKSFEQYKKTMLKPSEEEESESADSESGSEEESEDKEDEYDAEKSYAKCVAALEEMAAEPGNVMYNRIGPALHHVLQATRAHMLFFTENLAESQEIAKNIKPVMEMSQENLAGFEAIKAKFICTSYQDVRVAVETCQKAVELDPNFGAWYYFTGKYIRRLRRDFKEEMPKEELEYFEKAVALEKDPKHLVFLAQAYQEMAQVMSKQGADGQRSADEVLKKAVDLYRQCWNLRNDSAAISRRVGNGMMKMKRELIDLTVAKEALLKSVELTGTSNLHQLGRFYYKFEKDDEKALECFENLRGVYGPGEVIRLNLIKNPDYDPVEIIKYWETNAPSWVKRDPVYCDIGWYYLTMKRDLKKAGSYFWRVLSRDWNSFRLMQFQSYAFCVWGPINMLKILANEILLELKTNETNPPESRTDTSYLESVLAKVLEKHPELNEISPNPHLLEGIKLDTKNAIQSLKNKRYGYSNRQRGDGNQRIEAPGSWRRSSQSEDAEASGGSENRQDSRRFFTDEMMSMNRRPESNRDENRAWTKSRFDRNQEGDGYNRGMRSGFDSDRTGLSNSFDSHRENNSFRNRTRFDSDREGNEDGFGNRLGSSLDSNRNRSGISNRFDSNRENTSCRGGMRSRGGIDWNREGNDAGIINRFGSRQYGYRNREEENDRQNPNRDGMRRQSNNSNNRYDVTVTDWRSENRSKS